MRRTLTDDERRLWTDALTIEITLAGGMTDGQHALLVALAEEGPLARGAQAVLQCWEAMRRHGVARPVGTLGLDGWKRTLPEERRLRVERRGAYRLWASPTADAPIPIADRRLRVGRGS